MKYIYVMFSLKNDEKEFREEFSTSEEELSPAYRRYLSDYADDDHFRLWGGAPGNEMFGKDRKK